MNIVYLVYMVALGALSLIYLGSKDGRFNSKAVYWLFAIPLVIYTAARPMDISRDDLGYLEIIGNRERYGDRDFAWHGLVAVFSDWGYDYRAVLVATAFFLLVKLYLIQRLLDRRVPALFLYVAIFWQLHDLTQIRLAWAMTFVLFFVFAEGRGYFRRNLAIAASATFHIQTTAFFVSQFRMFRLDWRQLALMFGFSYVVVQAGLFELINWSELSAIVEQLAGGSVGNLFRAYGLLAEAKRGTEQRYPVIMVASFSILIYCFYRMRAREDEWIRDASNSIAFSILFVAFFSPLNDVMVRFHEMFLIYSVLMIGKCQDLRAGFSLLLLGILYFMKFNVFWSLLSW